MLLDYGHLHQVIISNPDQVKNFGRKIEFCISSAFSRKSKYVQLYIQGIPPEWTSLGRIIPTQHLIRISTYFQSKPNLIDICEGPWLCSRIKTYSRSNLDC